MSNFKSLDHLGAAFWKKTAILVAILEGGHQNQQKSAKVSKMAKVWMLDTLGPHRSGKKPDLELVLPAPSYRPPDTTKSSLVLSAQSCRWTTRLEMAAPS